MNKCLRITLMMEPKEGFLRDIIQKYARKYELEGFVQPVGTNNVKIVVSGQKEQVDAFVDSIQDAFVKADIHDIEIEPFMKDKDYRGVFRIIE